MLQHIGEGSHAERIRQAFVRTLTERNVRTRDLAGTATTSRYADAILRELDTIDSTSEPELACRIQFRRPFVLHDMSFACPSAARGRLLAVV